ncbi:LytTR family transcriptional regulator DNA-binding domain-containing protein [Marispirochaeta sp.]|uniref:LytR/AlgR family response regulator transcription factor n=1 Tax=Marispirochaeta sp. TaxID=2038653 RepID=UPI0029C7F6E7|nr:LytTR family transcriptional regulator DNA-binding domain-containing protein [Marispirochaeta sp.]
MIRVLIADDEKPARGRLASFISEYSEFMILGEASDGMETVALVNRMEPDVLFLDIQMPKNSGFEVLQQIEYDPIIIFTTAYDEYAIDAFEVHALDYLLKPFSKERFSRTVAIIKKILNDPRDYKSRVRNAMQQIDKDGDFLERVTVKDKHIFTIIPARDIQCIKTAAGLVYIQSGDKEYPTDTTLNQFEQRLDPSMFMRIHRTAIVNLERIEKILPWGQGRFALVLENGHSLHISRDRLQEFKVKVGLKL